MSDKLATRLARVVAIRALGNTKLPAPLPGCGFSLVPEFDADGREVNADRITGFLMSVDDAAEPVASN